MSLYNVSRKIVNERRKRHSKYKKFMQAVLAYYGVSNPEQLDPAKKKQFYKYIDSQWKRFKASIQTGE